jgi:hypothetical protein
MAQEPRKSREEIKREIDRSRDRLARELEGLRYELDIPRKIRHSLQSQTAVWVGAAALIGFAFTFLPRRKKEIYVDAKSGRPPKKHNLLEAGFLLGALKITATLLKPTLTKFIANKMRDFAASDRAPRKE